jgi:hypothetical protein
LLAPGIPRPPPPPQVQKLHEEFPSLLHPSAAPPKPLRGVVHHIDTGSAAPVFALLAAGPGKTLHRQRRVPRLGKSRYYLPLKLSSGIPAAPSPQEGWVVAPLWRLPPPEHRHHTRQVPLSLTCSVSMIAWLGALFFQRLTWSKPTIRFPLQRKTSKKQR